MTGGGGGGVTKKALQMGRARSQFTSRTWDVWVGCLGSMQTAWGAYAQLNPGDACSYFLPLINTAPSPSGKEQPMDIATTGPTRLQAKTLQMAHSGSLRSRTDRILDFCKPRVTLQLAVAHASLSTMFDGNRGTFPSNTAHHKGAKNDIHQTGEAACESMGFKRARVAHRLRNWAANQKISGSNFPPLWASTHPSTTITIWEYY